MLTESARKRKKRRTLSTSTKRSNAISSKMKRGKSGRS